MTKLYPYQAEAIQKIYREFDHGKRSILFQMPTGTGKTVLFSALTKQGYDHQRKVLIVVHRRELIDQAVKHLQAHGIDCGIILSGETMDLSKLVQVASIQTLTRRTKFETNLVIIDEAHHCCAETYKKLWTYFPMAKFLGVTATPCRLDGKGFEQLFEVLVTSQQIKEFVNQGYLVKVKHYIGMTPDLKKVKKQCGDYKRDQLSKAMRDPKILINLVESYEQFTKDKSCIIFAVDIEHSHDILKNFRLAGYTIEHVDGKTPKSEREQILQRFRQKETTLLSNVGIITEGFDMPDCEVVLLARPTCSLGLYLQMTGRVMRIAKDKEFGIVLDCAGNWKKHGLCQGYREWQLTGYVPHAAPMYIKDQMITEEGDVKANKAIEEVSNVELVDMASELERLNVFEEIVTKVVKRKWKLLAAYFQYETFLKTIGETLTKMELHYIANQLKRINKNYPKDKRFHPAFFTHKLKELV